MKDIKFGKLTIGKGHPTAIIAELCVNHNGSMDTAKRLVDAAKEAGADIAKFQLHLIGVEMVPNSVQMWGGSLEDILRETQFQEEAQMKIKEYCESVGIEYLCTPFCPAAVDILDSIGINGFKTGSGELTNLPQQRKIAKICAAKKKMAIVSTGMSYWEEVVETVRVYEEECAKDYLILTNCTSEYPPNDYSHANLGVIQRIEEELGVWGGQSDHTKDAYTAFAAVALGAKVSEKHFTLDRNQKGPDHGISLEPHMMKEMVEGIRKIEVALGRERSVSKEEQVVRDWAYHSVIANHDIKAGEVFTLDNLIPKRPGSGIPAKYLDKRYSEKLLGKKAKHDMPENTIVQWDDIA